MTVYEMAKKYYPRLWSIERIESLYKAGKLTYDEYKSIIEDSEEQGGIE